MTALNFPDSPSNGDTYQGYTYNSTKGTWAKPAVQDARTAVYANIAALPTSGTAGDMAFVTATNRLYLWTGTGWYNIALINNNPTISGVNASYNLAIDGTATTVTITATDPEGLPITYSIVSDTSGNTATVTQGTGANTNVFTITPSTNTAHAGTFSLTFRASDGVNIASAAASFTLQFSVQNSRYTSSLITSVGANNAVNKSFDDKSTSDHTITANGNITQTTFSPHRHGGYSAYFDGNGDYLQTNTNYTCSGEFTLEFWMHSSAYATSGANSRVFASVGGSNAANNFQLIIGKSTDSGSTGGSIDIWTNAYTAQGTTNVSNAEWHHIAVTRNSSNVMTLYIDGTSNVTGTNTTAFSFSNSRIATRDATNDATSKFNGYIRDLRLVEGTAVYTSNFTPPTEPLTAITNTKLLACHLPYFADGSTNAHTVTPNGGASTRPLAPYDGREYAAADHGASISNDGTGTNYLSVTSSDFEFGTSDDFVIEAWVYPRATPSNAAQVIDNRGAANGFNLAFTSANKFFNQSEPASQQFESTAKTLNQWYHVAVVRYNGTRRLFVNGVSEASVSDTGNYNSNTAVITSRHSQDQQALNGNVSDLRIIRGTIPTAYQGTSLTVPTAPLTAVTNTKLLVSSTDAGIIDKGQSAKDLTLFGNTKSSTTQNKFLTSSMYFDGSGDYLKWTNTEAVDWGIGGEPFTLEWWQWWPSIVDSRSVGPQTGGTTAGWNSSSGHQWTMFTYSSSATLFMQWWNGSGRTDYELNHGGALTASTWQHFAIVYDGTNLSNYIDGTRIGHRTSGNTFGTVSTRFAVLGGNTAGTGQSAIYYSDVRITKGLARYSGTSLTVPTAALKG